MLRDGLLAKTWLAADISYRFEGKYDLLSLIDDVDFWDSHILGVDYGSSNNLVHAFFEVVKKNKIERGDVNKPNKPTGFRDLAKELTRQNPTTCFEIMDYSDVKDFVQKIWDDRSSWDSIS